MQSEVYIVNWKKQKEHVEIFDDLKVFIESYPRYSHDVLNRALAFGFAVFEDEDVRIQKKAVISCPKPDFPPKFFWEFYYDKINWKEGHSTVIQRILERGSTVHWQELVRYYGQQVIVNALKETITYLPDKIMDEASLYFKMNKEDMLCYKRKQSQPGYWP